MRFYGTKGSKWRENMNTVLLDEGVWGDMKYTFNGNTYIIPAKYLHSRETTNKCINACKQNNTEAMMAMGIHIVGG